MSRTYRPQDELLTYLRQNGLKTYVVSAGGADFMRAFTDEVYGIPREQVIGSSVKLRYDTAPACGPFKSRCETQIKMRSSSSRLTSSRRWS
jgi:hypothetical protein